MDIIIFITFMILYVSCFCGPNFSISSFCHLYHLHVLSVSPSCTCINIILISIHIIILSIIFIAFDFCYVSNATVLQRSHCKRLSAILKFRQLCLFQSIAVLPDDDDDDVRRRCIFQPSSFILQNLSAPHRRGRPKQIWASEVYRIAVEIAEGFDMLGDLLRDVAKWRSKVRAFCFLPPG